LAEIQRLDHLLATVTEAAESSAAAYGAANDTLAVHLSAARQGCKHM